MPELQTLDCLQPGLGKLERVRYFNRMLLTAEDMRTDQDFVLQKLRRHNRFLHGWGVVCGLNVTAAATGAQPWRVQVAEGYALGPFGDEIFVGEPVFMDLAACGPGSVTNPCEPGLMLAATPAAGPEVYVAITYAECRARPVLTMPGGCGCEDEACEYSRIRDSFSLECLAELPASHVPDPDAPTLCELASGAKLLSCLPCPTEPWVVLAKVKLPAAGGTALAESGIDNKPPIRRLVFSTALIQQQVIDCCCGRRPEEPTPPLLTRLAVTIKAPLIADRGDERATVPYAIMVTNSGTVAAEHVRIEERFDNIAQLSEFKVEAFQADPGASWLDQVPPDLVATIARIDPGKTVTVQAQASCNWRRLSSHVMLRNSVSISSETPLAPDSQLHSHAESEFRMG